MKTSLLAAAAALSLITETALAGEGEGEPFPFRAPSLTVAINPAMHAQPGSARHPDLAGYPAQFEAAINSNLSPFNGSEGAVHTANSLPPGFVEGSVAYTQAQSVQRYLAQQASGLTVTAQRQSAPRG